MELFDENEETSEEDEALLISFLEDMVQDFDVLLGTSRYVRVL